MIQANREVFLNLKIAGIAGEGLSCESNPLFDRPHFRKTVRFFFDARELFFPFGELISKKLIGADRKEIGKRRKKLEFVELSQAEAVADEGKDLLELVLADERKRRVNEAVARLPRDMAAAVHLVYFAQLTYEETARVMKKSRKQVDNLLQRAKKELRIILGEDGERLL